MDFPNETWFEHYNKFYVNGPFSYSLSVSDASGSAGDSLQYHNGRRFSTADYDVDGNSRSCAITNQGAWWFYKCQNLHLNGVYYYGASPGSEKGITWRIWKRSSYSLQRTEMKTRPSRLTWKENANEWPVEFHFQLQPDIRTVIHSTYIARTQNMFVHLLYFCCSSFV